MRPGLARGRQSSTRATLHRPMGCLVQGKVELC